MTHVISLDAEGLRLQIAVQVPAEAAEEGAYSATPAQYIVDCGYFRGSFDADVYAGDLRRLRRALLHLQDCVGRGGEADVQFVYRTMTLHLALNHLGQIGGEVTLHAGFPDDRTLTCPVHADQTYIRLWLRSLDDGIETFPEDWRRLILT